MKAQAPMFDNNKRSIEDEDDSSGISVYADHIYFYSDVTPESALALNQRLHQVSMRNLSGVFNTMYEVAPPPPIWLHINSYGGEVFSALAIADTIKRISTVVPVVTIVEGCAASAATIISTAATRRLMRKHSFMLIHQLSDAAWGTFSQLEDNYKSNTRIMKTLTDWYVEHTKLKEPDLKEVLKHDIWWNSNQCKKNGLVDDII